MALAKNNENELSSNTNNYKLDTLAKIYELWDFEEFKLPEADGKALSDLSERVYSLTKPKDYKFSKEEVVFLSRLWVEYVEPLARKL